MLTLHTVAHSSRCPAKEKARSTSLSVGELEPIAQGLVLLLVDLEPALDQVQRGHRGVGDATGESSANRTESVVLGGPKLTRVFVGGASNHGPEDEMDILDIDLFIIFTSWKLPEPSQA